ncbi:MAG: hypothetical protein M3Y77_09890 [Actinomycetota bacterium]|nr:hypothetical protein [Actinomycetota bacterium]
MTESHPQLITRERALAGGLRDPQIAKELRSGSWSPVRPGGYASGIFEFPEGRHRLQVEAAIGKLNGACDAVVSHASAAVVHGLQVWQLPLDRVHLTRPGRPGIASTKSIRPHRGQLTDAEITEVGGFRVTTVARTILDIARTVPFTQAVVVADSGLRAGTTKHECVEVLNIANSHRSAGGAARVIAFADGRSESAAESRSRVLMARHGLPEPRLQVRITGVHGHQVAIVDFDFDTMDTVGECDGLSKYTRYLRPGETAADVVIREKRREDDIRATGRQVVRWIPRELVTPQRILDRFVAAFARAGFPDWRPEPPPLVLGAHQR